ncbi:hypothetical protein [Solitalea longa]|uniref:hypothetical protein n=1 Tax=Solitalea longa TaxID=2079460 RepID=UPI001A9C450B|nr:hypothetical protein [Solitalea longa]
MKKNEIETMHIKNGKAQPEKKTVLVDPGQLNSTIWAGNVPQIKQGTYSDGLPYNELNYLAFKLILKPNRFVSRSSLFDLVKVMKKPAIELGCDFQTEGFINMPIKIREVLFVDTPDFRLYNNGFILRRRIAYEDGFPASNPEIVFKFRHPDLQQAAETDVRPLINGDYRVKFKCQALPLRDQLGGIRMLYSHNVQFPRSSVVNNDVFSFDTISQIFPVLAHLKKGEGDRIQLVNDMIVEEVLQDIGILDLGDGIKAKVNMAIWRTRGEHRPLIAELAYQIRFKDRKELKLEAMQRAERYFIMLQYAAKDWISLNATKTGVVYRFLGNPPKSHE